MSFFILILFSVCTNLTWRLLGLFVCFRLNNRAYYVNRIEIFPDFQNSFDIFFTFNKSLACVM